jgi:hypothetical protein
MDRVSSRARRALTADVESVTEIEQLRADLQALVDTGLVVEVREPGQPPRYALSVSGHDLTSSSTAFGHMSEPCPACGATEGFDGGARCHRCHVAWPPEM